MTKIHTHYDNLKVTRNAPSEVIKAAYRVLTQKYHPDKHGGSADATRVMREVNAAYDTLMDPVKRAEHDAWISGQEVLPQQTSPPPPPPGPAAQYSSGPRAASPAQQSKSGRYTDFPGKSDDGIEWRAVGLVFIVVTIGVGISSMFSAMKSASGPTSSATAVAPPLIPTNSVPTQDGTPSKDGLNNAQIEDRDRRTRASD
jgi:curved DNA-binding protein CbpA